MQDPHAAPDTFALLKDSLFAIQALREWVHAVPDDTPLPAMPGIDSDWLDELESSLVPVVKAPPPTTCSWTPSSDEAMPGTFFGSCGVAWTFTEGGPGDNDMHFCPKCGGRLNVHVSEVHTFKPVQHLPATGLRGPDRDVGFLRQVLSVAIAGLYEHYKNDVLRAFTLDELQTVVDLSEPLRHQHVEDIYKQAWAMLAAAPQPTPLQAQVSGVVLREGIPTLLRDNEIKKTDVRLCVNAPSPLQLEPLSNSKIMASVGRHIGGEKTALSESRPLGQQWPEVCELVRMIIAERFSAFVEQPQSQVKKGERQ
jgi:hypothetical protein